VLLAVEEYELEKVPPTMDEEEECEPGHQDLEDEESERVHVAVEEVEEWEVEL
jgi:hypothetical protein